MFRYIRAGGYTMWVLIILSAVMITLAIRFLLKPTPERLAVLRSLTWAHILAIVGGVATNLIAVCHSAIEDIDRTGKLDPSILIWGTGEALTPAGFGFSILAFIWLIIALAVRRAHQPPA